MEQWKSFVVVIALLLIAGCSPKMHKPHQPDYSIESRSAGVYTQGSTPNIRGSRSGVPQAYIQEVRVHNGSGQIDQTERLVVHSAFLNLEVKDIDTAESKLLAIAQKYNGYVSETGTHRIVIRIASESLREAISEIEGTGNLRSKRIRGRDITDDYWDSQIRLENAVKARERYLELLEQAETVEAALKVEVELERLNEVIDRLKGQLNRMEHLVTYSTITVSLKEKVKPGILGYIGIGVYRSIRWLFVRN